MHRRQFVKAGAVAILSSVAGCSSSPGTITVGESHETNDFTISVPRVEVAETVVANGPNGRQELQRSDSVLATPYVRIENVGDSSLDLPDPLSDIDVLYEGSDATRVIGRIDTITVSGSTFDSYRKGYRDRNDSLPAGAVIEGVGAVYALPAEFDPTEAVVRIALGDKNYRWRFENG